MLFFFSTPSLLCSTFSSLSAPDLPFIFWFSLHITCLLSLKMLLAPSHQWSWKGGLFSFFLFVCFVLFHCFRNRLSLCNPGCLRMFCVEQAGLELSHLHLSLLPPIGIKSMRDYALLNFCLHPFTYLNFSTPDSNQMTISDHEIVKMSCWQQIFVSDHLEHTLKFYCELL